MQTPDPKQKPLTYSQRLKVVNLRFDGMLVDKSDVIDDLNKKAKAIKEFAPEFYPLAVMKKNLLHYSLFGTGRIVGNFIRKTFSGDGVQQAMFWIFSIFTLFFPLFFCILSEWLLYDIAGEYGKDRIDLFFEKQGYLETGNLIRKLAGLEPCEHIDDLTTKNTRFEEYGEANRPFSIILSIWWWVLVNPSFANTTTWKYVHWAFFPPRLAIITALVFIKPIADLYLHFFLFCFNTVAPLIGLLIEYTLLTLFNLPLFVIDVFNGHVFRWIYPHKLDILLSPWVVIKAGYQYLSENFYRLITPLIFAAVTIGVGVSLVATTAFIDIFVLGAVGFILSATLANMFKPKENRMKAAAGFVTLIAVSAIAIPSVMTGVPLLALAITNVLPLIASFPLFWTATALLFAAVMIPLSIAKLISINNKRDLSKEYWVFFDIVEGPEADSEVKTPLFAISPHIGETLDTNYHTTHSGRHIKLASLRLRAFAAEYGLHDDSLKEKVTLEKHSDLLSRYLMFTPEGGGEKIKLRCEPEHVQKVGTVYKVQTLT